MALHGWNFNARNEGKRTSSYNDEYLLLEYNEVICPQLCVIYHGLRCNSAT